jgi:two-component system, NarL family, sensor histidine kinase UhpB
MKWKAWRQWGIAARLLSIAVLPAGVMALVVTITLQVRAQHEVLRDVAERGRLIAAAMAQSSQYGLVSGNVAYLRTTLHHLLDTDRSIDCIDILDAQRRSVVSACQPGSRPAQAEWSERLVQLDALPEVDLFEPLADAKPTRPATLRTVGVVRVSMTPEPLLQAKRQSLAVASAFVLAAAVLSCLLGWKLAARLRQTFAAVMRALRDVRRGRFDVQLEPQGEGELGELQQTIIEMAATLGAARHDLEQQVVSRTRALQEAVNIARQADEEKRRLIVHSNAAVEEERRRIAVEIHDQLGAALIAVRLEASALLARAEATQDDELTRGARRIAGTTESLYATARDIVKSLRPEVIDTLGLIGALEELVRNLDTVHPTCRVSMVADPGVPNLRGEQAMPVYRVTQEALTNVLKHAQATQVQVQLSVSADGGQLLLDIRDNGVGFDPQEARGSGIGLIGMRERVSAAGGQLQLTSSPGRGTQVRVSVPLKLPK